jgi:hypothetical protein
MTANGGYMSREKFASLQDLRTEDVPVPGGMLRVREMTAAERAWWEAESIEAAVKAGEGDNAMALVLAARTRMRTKVVRMCTVDEAGGPYFHEDDEEMLGGKSDRIVGPLFEAIATLSALGAKAQAEAVEKAEGFSEGTASTVPSSESPSI